jgi:predicted transcriptional regulator
METTIKNIAQQQQELIEQLQKRQEDLRSKFDAEGFVVAGYGGDTYYTFVGTGRGFNGAALAPMSRRPRIFETEKEASREANNGTYRNGRDEVIMLKVVKASTYFRTIHDEIEKNISLIKEQLSK